MRNEEKEDQEDQEKRGEKKMFVPNFICLWSSLSQVTPSCQPTAHYSSSSVVVCENCVEGGGGEVLSQSKVVFVTQCGTNVFRSDCLVSLVVVSFLVRLPIQVCVVLFCCFCWGGGESWHGSVRRVFSLFFFCRVHYVHISLYVL